MLKPAQLDKLEKMVDVIGVRSVILVAYTEGYAQALRESFEKITQVTQPSIIEDLIDSSERVLADMEHAGISETHPSAQLSD